MKHFLLLLIVLCLPFFMMAQDPAFSQFYANRIYLNPAFAGAQEGISVNAAYRNQWYMAHGPLWTGAVSVDVQEKCLGSGLSFDMFMDQEGEGVLQTAGVGFTYAYIIPIFREKGSSKRLFQDTDLHIGFRSSMVQKSIDWGRLIFSDQIDPINGIVKPSGAIPIRDNYFYPDFDFGMIWRQEFKHPIYKKTPIRTSLGMSVHHIFRPIESLYQELSKLPRRYTVHGGVYIPFAPNHSTVRGRNEKFFIVPNFRMELQDQNRLFSYGLYIQTPYAIYFGLFHQNQRLEPKLPNDVKGMVATIGFDMNNAPNIQHSFGFSYDFNYGGFDNAGGGVFEVTYRIQFKESNIFCNSGMLRGLPPASVKRIMDCNNFF
jgi:type IX secretion system PorP/SprF family membrane protein